ncbi:MAG: adenylyl-sulfate kinase [Humidesulfovibrio sp.]|nr:adenylyl-sulfate kinase [Humidesulfovibrio sp.]
MAFTLWFTGISGSGKSTLSQRLCDAIAARGLTVERLDGDIVRKEYAGLLGYEEKDRRINIRCLGFVSSTLNRHGIVSIVSAIAPYRVSRAQNREKIENYIEVFCDCPFEVAAARDAKLLYARARRGEIANFTGLTSPYECPECPDIVVHTDTESVDESVRAVLEHLERCRYLAPK